MLDLLPHPFYVPPSKAAHRFGLAPFFGASELVFGAIAQLGERLHGMQEVSGSIPLSSTNPPPANSMNESRFQITPYDDCIGQRAMVFAYLEPSL